MPRMFTLGMSIAILDWRSQVGSPNGSRCVLRMGSLIVDVAVVLTAAVATIAASTGTAVVITSTVRNDVNRVGRFVGCLTGAINGARSGRAGVVAFQTPSVATMVQVLDHGLDSFRFIIRQFDDSFFGLLLWC